MIKTFEFSVPVLEVISEIQGEETDYCTATAIAEEDSTIT